MSLKQRLDKLEGIAGTGDGSRIIRLLIEKAIMHNEEKKRLERIAEKGTELKLNPYVTDIGKCPKQNDYSFRNVPKTNPPSAASLFTFGIGNAVEDWVAGILEGLGVDTGLHILKTQFRIEVTHPDGVTVSGRLDAGIEFPDTEIILEFKSINRDGMYWLLKNQDGARPDHVSQCNQYLVAKRIDRGYVVYLVKDAKKGEEVVHAYRVDRDDERAIEEQDVLAQQWLRAQEPEFVPIPAEYLTKFRKSGKIPNYPCGYCDWQDVCWSEERKKRGAGKKKA
jgi:hypothetical protein